MLTFTSTPDTFTVEEIPAYAPSGEGTHLFLWIEKRGLTTFDAIARIARALGLAPRDIGYAGLKDRHALTRQWLSLPGIAAERALTMADADLKVLQAIPHPHKLRLGHLRGNRFEVTLTGDATEGEREAFRARFDALAASGVPNRFGAQRFGAGGDNAAVGLALLRGERRERDKRRRRLMLSALQSAVFNRALELRAVSGDSRAGARRRRPAKDRQRRPVRDDRSGGRSAARRSRRGDPDRTAPWGSRDRAPSRHALARHRRRGDRLRRRHPRGLLSRRARASGRAPRGVAEGGRPGPRASKPTPTTPSGFGSPCPPAATRRSSSTRSSLGLSQVRDPRRVPLPRDGLRRAKRGSVDA